MFRFIFTLLCFVLTIKTNRSSYARKVRIDVYYESLCRDSRKFVTNQLLPTMEKLHEYINLKFIPFGKAYSINDIDFQCQHGLAECRGNLVQGCVIEHLENSQTDSREIAKYVNCELINKGSTRGDRMCMDNIGVRLSQIRECIYGRSGIDLQLQYERMTKAISPKFIPTVVFDKNFRQNIQNLAIKDLTNTVCIYLKLDHVKACRDRLFRRRKSLDSNPFVKAVVLFL